MSEQDRKIQASKLLCDPTRYAIMSALLQEVEGMCVYEIADAVDISQSAASHQLSKLEAHGVVASYRSGQTMCYQFQESSDLGPYLKHILTFSI